MMLATDLAVLDHADGSVLLIANAINYDDTDERVDWAHARRRRAARPDDRRARPQPAAGHGRASSTSAEPAYDARPTPASDYRAAVDRAKEEIRAGEAFQVVRQPAVRDADRRRRARRLPDAAGHQPQPVHVPVPLRRLRRRRAPAPRPWSRSAGGRAMMHPIAGTRPRGEHARGGRRAGGRPARRPEGARRAPDARRPRPQRPRPGLRAGQRRGRRLHVGRAVQPRHAHRVHRRRRGRRRAHGVRRAHGLLPGRHAVRRARSRGRWSSSRSWSRPGAACTAGASATSTSPATLDTAIAIRTALLRDGVAYVQAGAGIVADSDPAAEDAECRNKAMAVLRAVAAAQSLRAAP